MSFQRITTIGSMPPANSEATPSRCKPVALVLEPVDLHQVGAEVGVGAQAAQRLGDLLGRPDEHRREVDGLLHRRLDAVQAELGGHMLGVVDDVIQGRRQQVSVAGVERRAYAPALGQAVDYVVGYAVALLLTDLQVVGQARALGIVHEQVAQQQRAALDVAAGLLNQPHQHRVNASVQQRHRARI